MSVLWVVSILQRWCCIKREKRVSFAFPNKLNGFSSVLTWSDVGKCWSPVLINFGRRPNTNNTSPESAFKYASKVLCRRTEKYFVRDARLRKFPAFYVSEKLFLIGSMVRIYGASCTVRTHPIFKLQSRQK